ncbi:cytochrome C oxidase subunit IV family protein [Pelobacter seleniigenes]|uniref:cytochrome C oxidase subunit IV family protein n=1 Tax=Pelobacter seleniigenes TaxID=407188 RepID=UPI0004A7590F|nr:cytochrome C oxidase subunit IV family protein [Pelobacter seleniigenes]
MSAHEHEHKHEPVPNRTFILVWVALLALTLATVAISRIHLGALHVWAALFIASIKSSLVIFIFMHLKQETRLFKIGLLVMLVILAIFVGLTFTDILYR